MLLSLIMAVSISATAADRSIARTDYARLPADVRRSYRYLSLSAVPPNRRDDVLQVVQFWLPHLASTVSLERQLPVHVGGSLYRIDLVGLGWNERAWLKVARSYPYDHYPNPLIFRAEWLVHITANAAANSAYYDLLYAPLGRAPANRTEFAKFWRLDDQGAKTFELAAIIEEGESGVAYGTRQVEVRTTSAGGRFWDTFDSARPTGQADPLERLGNPLEGGLKFDAGEQIVQIPKFDARSGEHCYAQAYLLTNGAGRRVDEADTNVVSDSSDEKPVVRTPESCVRCHATGINPLPPNAARALIADGIEVLDKRDERAELRERKFLGKLNRRIERDQQDFALFVKAVCGDEVEPTDVVAKYSATLAWYDSGVTLEQAARELDATPRALQLAIEAYTNRFARKQTARLSRLVKERRVPRDAWEDQVFDQAAKALHFWRSR